MVPSQQASSCKLSSPDSTCPKPHLFLAGRPNSLGLDGRPRLLQGGLNAVETQLSDAHEQEVDDRQSRRPINADRRTVGSLQADLPALGRYAGEVHLMTTDRPLTGDQVRVGSVAEPYVGIIDHLRGRARLRFIR